MKQMELSFGDANQNTAQFFNPESGKLKVPQKKTKREHSMPSTDFLSLLSKPILFTKHLGSRRQTLGTNNPPKMLKQKTMESTQESLNQIFHQINNKLKHSLSSYVVPKCYKSIPVQKENTQAPETRESRVNSRCSVVSAGGDKKRKIRVNDPYGLFAMNKTTKSSTRAFINQKAQNKLVDRIFSSRSDSIQ